jgi:hydrogenase-4 membrane subunit HyfE
MRKLATALHVLFAALLGLRGGAPVVQRVATAGWSDRLIVPLLLGVMGLAALVAGVSNARSSSTAASRVGLVLVVPLFTLFAQLRDYETSALVIAAVATGPILLSSLLHARAARAAEGSPGDTESSGDT